MFRWLLFLLPLLLATPSLAQGTGATPGTWPDRPIRLIIPFGPGGVSDGIGRAGADWLSRKLGVPVIADNRPGGNGIVGMEAVARAAPDGYTLLGASASHLVVLPLMQKLSLDPHSAFTPISMTAGNSLFLVVSPGLGLKTLKDFVDYVRARPGQLDFASGGTAGLSHLGMEFLLHRLGLSMQHVPYRSGPHAVQDLLGGRVPVYLGNAIDVLPVLQNNAVTLLAMTGRARSPILPDVPTVAEQGYPGFELGTWNGLAGPAGLPAPIRDRIAAIMGEACQDEGFRSTILRLGADPLCSTPEAMRDSIATLTPVMREAIGLSGAKVE
jgi:tripartite-type tricarboxylate transporter receptor subunit TctC